MPITVNESGVLKELAEITANESGTLYNLDTVHTNEGGVLQEIHSSLPQSLTWSADTAKDSTAKINSVSADGFTITYTSANYTWNVATNAIYSNFFRLPAVATIVFSFSNVTSKETNKHYGALIEKNGAIIGTGGTVIKEAGIYRIALRAHGVTGSQSGTSYGSCTVTVQISIHK